MKIPKYSIVIPAYAEERFIGSTLKDLAHYLAKNKLFDDTEVIVVTADAIDATQNIVKNSAKLFRKFKHIQPGPRVGKGRDVRIGLQEATGRFVIFMDADMATPLSYLEVTFDILEQNGGMVIGQRHLSQMHKTAYRRASSQLSNLFIKTIVGFDISDSQCGFKGFDRASLEILLPRMTINGWSFDIEMLKIAKKHGFTISHLDIPDWEDPKGVDQGLAGDRVLSAMLKSLKEAMQVQVRSWTKKYE